MDYTFEPQNKKFVIGASIKTSNAHFQEEAPLLWQKFYTEELAEKIPNRLDQNLIVVYTEYEGDHTQPFTYLMGCLVSNLKTIPKGLRGIEIAPAPYAVFTARGPFPDAMVGAWHAIWESNIPRAYTADFEVYPPDFDQQDTPEIKIYIALKSSPKMKTDASTVVL
ncbi:GyrI-like domain-containing protein [Chlamydiota bacterium]